MAKLDIPEIVRTSERPFREALAEAVEKTIKGAEFDAYELYKNFRERLERHFGSRFEVQDRYIDDWQEKK